MKASVLKKFISDAVYNRKKKEFGITFKEKDTARLFHLLMGDKTRKGNFSKTVYFDVSDDSNAGELLSLLDITTSIK